MEKHSANVSFGSVCSGIEAASCAWLPLGWRADWLSEIEPFPSAVLAYRHPDTINLGDMTQIAYRIFAGEVKAPDVLVGGTPCQAFSIAGLRGGLDDERGQLTLKYVELLNVIDETRIKSGHQPAISVWENVPGVLTSSDNAFGCFLAGLAGEDEPFEPGQRPERGKSSAYWSWNKSAGKHVPKWSKSGWVNGRQRKVAWRILDAQYFGVAQRRRRLFVISSARTDIDPTSILFECESVRRDSPPRRGSRKEIAEAFTSCAGTSGLSGSVTPELPVVGAISANSFTGGAGGRPDGAAAGHFIPISVTGDISHALRGDGFDGSEDGTGRGTPIIAMAHGQGGAEIKTDDSAPTLTCNHEAPIAVLAFPEYMSSTQCAVKEGLSPSLMSRNPTAIVLGNVEADAPPAVAYGFQPRIARNGRGNMGDICHSLNAQSGESGKGDAAPCVAVAFAENNRGELRLQEGDGNITGPLSTGGGKPGQGYPAIATKSEVRRLTPVECERLQGFPDNWTLIPVEKRKKVTAEEYAYLRHHFPNMTAEEAYRLAADGPRYKAIGNSMAVPVMAWIGKRVDNAIREARTVKSTVTHLRSVRAPAEFERPIFKWVGGKFSVMEVLNEHLPHGKRLIEPFVGGGSVFTNAGYSQNLLNDVNGHLINFYKVLQRDGHALITLAHQYFRDKNTAKEFLKVRRIFNERAYNDQHFAAAFLYLNRHAFNGLVRYNLSGGFNVGYGKYKAPYFPLEEMETFLGMSNQCEFVSGDFAGVITQAHEGDVVFCDPPYEPLPGKDGFTSYSGHSFGFDEQERLVSLLVAAHQRGAKVLITNSGAPKIRELYQDNGFTPHELLARRSVSCKSDSREKASDILAKLGC